MIQLPLKQFAAGSQPYKRQTKIRSQFTHLNIETPGSSYMLERGMVVQSKKTLLFEDEENNLNYNNNAICSRTPRHYEDEYGCQPPQQEEYHQQKKPREFRDLRHPPTTSQASTSSISTIPSKPKREANTGRVFGYNVGDTEKMKFNK